MSARSGNLFILAILPLLNFFTLPNNALAIPVCGPGDHWIDSCSTAGGPSGNAEFYTDTFDSVATISIDQNFDNVGDFTAVLGGIVKIFRGDPYQNDPVNDPGHLNRIDTEIVEMTLSGGGVTLRAGDGNANLSSDNNLYSGGSIIEKSGDPTLADSFFDVFVEIEFNGMILYNIDPFVIAAEIDQVPPLGINYLHPFSALPVKLYDISDINGLNPIAQIIEANHKPLPVPEPSAYLLLSIGLVLLALRRRNNSIVNVAQYN